MLHPTTCPLCHEQYTVVHVCPVSLRAGGWKHADPVLTEEDVRRIVREEIIKMAGGKP